MEFERVVTYIEELIINKTLKSGEKLPSVNLVSKRFECSKTEVIKAYFVLENNNLVYSINKKEFYLLNIDESNLISNKIDFKSLICKNTILDKEQLACSLNQLIKDNRGFNRNGCYDLRYVLKHYFLERKIFSGIDNIIITTGAQQAFNIIFDVVLKNGGNILIENPTYPKVIKLLKYKKNKFRVNTFLRKTNNLDFNIIEYNFIKKNIKIMYITPDFHTPTGFSISLADRQKLLKLCFKYNVIILEDNYLEDINEYIETQSLFALDKNGIVFHVKSFSKVFSSNLQLGAFISPEKYKRNIIENKEIFYSQTSIIEQSVVYYFLNSEMYKKKQNEIASIYSKRMEYVKEIFKKNKISERYQIHIPYIGLVFFIEVPGSFNLQMMIIELKKKNVHLSDIKKFFYNEEYFKGVYVSLANVDEKEFKYGLNLIIEYLIEIEKY